MTTAAAQKLTVTLTRPLVLVGLMGAGKTSVGRRLAAFLDVPFHDSDQEMVEASGMEVSEIFERFGEPYFRDREVQVIQRLLDGPVGVLATGGGAFMQAPVRALVEEKARSVWLDAALETLWNRVKDKPTRPLLQQPEPKRVLADLLAVRAPTYALADIRVESEPEISHETMVRRILEAVHDFDLAHPDERATLVKVS